MFLKGAMTLGNPSGRVSTHLTRKWKSNAGGGYIPGVEDGKMQGKRVEMAGDGNAIVLTCYFKHTGTASQYN